MRDSKFIIHNSKLYRLLLSLLFAAALSSCEKIVEFDPGNVEPKVVMISRCETDSLVNVYMGFSRFFLDGHTCPTIDNAALTLDAGGTLHLPTPLGDGLYRFAYQPQEGDTMTLRAVVSGQRPIVAGTRVPQRPQVLVRDFVVDTDGYYEMRYRIRFRLTAPDNNSYYSLRVAIPRVLVDTNDAVSFDTTQHFNLSFSSTDALLSDDYDLAAIIDGDDGEFYGQEAVFGSELFQGLSHEFTIEVSYYHDSYYNGVYYSYVRLDPAQFPLYLELRALSTELYQYERTCVQQDAFDQMLSEPVQVICNVQNGIGLFGSISTLRQKLLNPRYEDFYHDQYK